MDYPGGPLPSDSDQPTPPDTSGMPDVGSPYSSDSPVPPSEEGPSAYDPPPAYAVPPGAEIPPTAGFEAGAKKKSPLVWVIGIVVVGGCCVGIPILAAILFPVFSQAKLAAVRTQSLKQIKQIATATQIYAADNDDCLPERNIWTDQVQTYIEDESIFIPPTADKPVSYAYSSGLDGLESYEVDSPSATVMYFESVLAGQTNVYGTFADRYERGDRTILAFVDGSAKAARKDDYAGILEVPAED